MTAEIFVTNIRLSVTWKPISGALELINWRLKVVSLEERLPRLLPNTSPTDKHAKEEAKFIERSDR